LGCAKSAAASTTRVARAAANRRIERTAGRVITAAHAFDRAEFAPRPGLPLSGAGEERNPGLLSLLSP